MSHLTPSGARTGRAGTPGLLRLGMVVVALLALSGVLAACGSSNKSSGNKSTSASGGSLNSADAKEFRNLIGISDADLAKLKGKSFKLGAILPLSGPGAQYATEEQNGLKLAVDDMKRYVGLNVTYEAKDHKSGDPQAGAAASREFGLAGYGNVANSYYGVFGATLPAIQRYKMLSIDPGGGTGNCCNGKDFFWADRADTPDAGFYGLKYFKQKDPSAKRVALLVWDAGAAYYSPIEQHLKAQVAANGMQYAGRVLQKIGQTDYSSVLSKLRSLNPDIIWLGTFATDPANFMKQYVSSGLKAQVVAPEYTAAAQKVAGSAYKKLMFASDFFPFKDPPNPLSKFMVKDYKRLFGSAADTYYTPFYYDTGIIYLELAKRVANAGGDINNGAAMQKALENDPTFPSVLGGDSSTVGQVKLDPATHDPTVRPIGLFQASATLNDVKQLAIWNVDGSGFKITG